MKKLWIVSVMVGIALLFGIQSTARAVPYIEVFIGDLDASNNPIHPMILVQDGSAQDLNSALGAVTLSASIGVWTVNVSTGVTYPQGNSNAAVPYLDLNSINSSSAGGRLFVGMDAIGYTGPISATQTGPFFFHAGGTVADLTTGSLFLTALYNSSNVLFGDGGGPFVQIGHLGPFPQGFFGASTDIAAFDGTANPYGLGIQANIIHDGAGSTSFDSSLQSGKVPEPISLILLGSGLAGAGLYRRFRKPKV